MATEICAPGDRSMLCAGMLVFILPGVRRREPQEW